MLCRSAASAPGPSVTTSTAVKDGARVVDGTRWFDRLQRALGASYFGTNEVVVHLDFGRSLTPLIALTQICDFGGGWGGGEESPLLPSRKQPSTVYFQSISKRFEQDLLSFTLFSPTDRQINRKLTSFRSKWGGKESRLMESLRLVPLHHGFYYDVGWRLQPSTVPIGVQREGELFGT